MRAGVVGAGARAIAGAGAGASSCVAAVAGARTRAGVGTEAGAGAGAGAGVGSRNDGGTASESISLPRPPTSRSTAPKRRSNATSSSCSASQKPYLAMIKRQEYINQRGSTSIREGGHQSEESHQLEQPYHIRVPKMRPSHLQALSSVRTSSTSQPSFCCPWSWSILVADPQAKWHEHSPHAYAACMAESSCARTLWVSSPSASAVGSYRALADGHS